MSHTTTKWRAHPSSKNRRQSTLTTSITSTATNQVQLLTEKRAQQHQSSRKNWLSSTNRRLQIQKSVQTQLTRLTWTRRRMRPMCFLLQKSHSYRIKESFFARVTSTSFTHTQVNKPLLTHLDSLGASFTSLISVSKLHTSTIRSGFLRKFDIYGPQFSRQGLSSFCSTMPGTSSSASSDPTTNTRRKGRNQAIIRYMWSRAKAPPKTWTN